jgi:3(or 17)beta-hydroxysteroid dehydrogenase
MTTRLAERVVVIAGGAGGVGRACAEQVVREGGHAVITDVDEAGGQALAEALGARALFRRLDIASEAGWAALMAEVAERFGGLHGLVNAAAICPSEDLEATSLALFQKVQRINVDGVFLGCQAAVRAMRANRPDGPRGGSIVNVVSTAAVAGHRGLCAYTASKGAVAALTRNVAAHCRAQGLFVRCNAVIPGGIKTPMTATLVATLPREVTDIAVSPTANFCDPVDVAHAVTYLLGEESRFVNGSELRVDNALLSAIA